MLIKYYNIFEVRAFPAGIDRYSKFIEEGFIAIGWASIGDLSDFTDNDIKELVNKSYTQYNQGKLTQIANFFIRLKGMKPGDIILIPYISPEDGPILSIATVVKGYSYYDKYEQDDIAHQVKIRVITTISREMLAEKYKAFNQTLNARLTITKIDQKRHQKAIEYIQAIIHNSNNYSNVQTDIHVNYTRSIESIATSLKKIKNNDLLKKSLILSALSLNESYLVSLIRGKIIPLIQDNQILYDVLEKTLLNNLSNRQTREQIASAYFKNYTLPKDYYTLRNKLAHSMDSITLDGLEANFTDQKTYEENKNKGKDKEQIPHVNVNTLLNTLLNYVDNIKELDNIE